MTADASRAAPPRHSLSPEATERLGEALAVALREGDVIALSGPLGAGKTCFVAGLARGIGAPGRVRSPSFTLVHEYRGMRLLLHLDLYRLEPAEVDGLGLDEQLERGALVAEWGEKLPGRMLVEALRLTFELRSERERSISAAADCGRGIELLEAWRAIAEAR